MKYYIPCAKNTLNNQRIQEQNLATGKGYTDRNQALLVAQTLCEKLAKKQRGNWVPFVKSVTK